MMTEWKKALILLSGLSLLCTGCGNAVQAAGAESGMESGIELIEPVGVTGSYEVAAVRNIYESKVYGAIVFPKITEYEFNTNRIFEGYAAFPGQSVSKGTALLYSRVADLQKQIEDMQEKIADMEKEYTEFVEDIRESLKAPKEEQKLWGDAVENMEKVKPEQYIQQTVTSGNAGTEASEGMVENPEYIKWKNEYDGYLGRYSAANLSVEQKEASLRQRTELYELDMQYNRSQLAKKQEQLRQGTLSAEGAGEVVSISHLSEGDYIPEGNAVMALGDTEQIVLKCDYIDTATLAKASHIYALVNGTQYEVEHEPMDMGLYKKLTDQGIKTYSTFHFVEEPKDVSLGDYAVITLLTNEEHEFLSVPNSAVHKDAGSYFVYVEEDGETVRKDIKRGITDGVYTEVISGIEEGTRVLTDENLKFGEKTTLVEYGTSSNSFEGSGYLYYPDSIAVSNDVEYGTVYFGEYQVSMYQRVKKGDVIATLQIIPDDITLLQKQKELERAQQRLEDLKKLGETENERAIKEKEEAIAEIQKVITQIRSDAATTEVVAEKNGIIISLSNFENKDILEKNVEIAQIADENNCYVALTDTNQLLNYGNEVTLTYKNKENISVATEGTVVTVSAAGILNNSLNTEYALIKIPEDAIADMVAATEDAEVWWRRVAVNVEAEIRKMDGVLVVPRKAVREINGHTYVCVEREDGSTLVTGFVAGGYDQQQYWVVEGLTEGMKVCCE